MAEKLNEMDKVIEKMMEHVCDDICRFRKEVSSQEDLEAVCAECDMGHHICNILNCYQEVERKGGVRMNMTAWLAQQTLAKMRFDLSIISPGLNAVNEKMALEMGVSALDMGIGKMPKSHDADKKEFICPSCEKTIIYLDIKEKHKHCLNCGQAFQWH